MATPCRFWNGLRIVYSPFRSDSRSIVIQKCPITLNFNDEIIQAYSIDEFERIPDIYAELQALVKRWPKDHHLETHPFGCPTDFQNCFCDPELLQLKFVEVSLTTECNALCRFCGVRPTQVKAKLNNDCERLRKLNSKIFESLKGHNLDYIRFTDEGEPLIYKKEIEKYIKNLNISDVRVVRLTTNGTLLDDNFISLMERKREEGIFIVPIISLNAYNSDSYFQKMCIDKFDHVLSIIYKLKKKNFDFKVSFLIDNKDEVDEIANFVKQLLSVGIRCGVWTENKQSNYLSNEEKIIKLKELTDEFERTRPVTNEYVRWI